jgi:hypothetical protein
MKRIYKLNRWIWFIPLCTLSPYWVQGQNYQRKLNWQPKAKTFTLAEKTITQPTFSNAIHSEQFGLLPFYTEIIPLNISGEISLEVLNPVYSTAGALDNASLTFIKGDIETKAELSFFRKQPNAHVSILPFRKTSSGSIEKLETFSLRITVTPKPQKRAANAYASNSVLANGAWYKIAVNADGIFKVDYNFIKSTLGVDPNSFSLNTLAVFGNGGGMVPDANSVSRPDDLLENPSLVIDNNGNNRLDADDYLLFYGQMPDKWNLNTGTQSFEHSKNLYTDKTYYFLTTTSGTGKRAQILASTGTPNKTITDFDERYFHESDEENILRSGKEWLGDKMTSFNSSKSFSLSFPNLITSVQVKFKSSLGAKTDPPGSSTTVTINSQPVITQGETGIAASSYPDAYRAVENTVNYSATSEQLNIAYSFSVASDPSGTASCYINYFELNLKRALSLSGSAMTFRNISSVGAGNISQFLLNSASASTKVWDVTNVGDIKEMQGTLNGSQLSFTTATDDLREFIAFNTNGTFSNPEYIGQTPNQNLHSIGQPDMVIVTYDGFEAPSNELAAFHRTNENISVSVVKLSQIYNEFGSGKPDISAIRDFMRMLYDRAGNDTALMPRYLLLMGDGSYDPKGRIAESNNFIPTYQSYQSISVLSSYTSDDFYGLLDANEGGDITTTSQQLDIGIGRLPVESESEAWDVVNKIKNYKFPQVDASCVQISSNAAWRNVLCFIADDLDEGGTIFETYSEALANTTRSQNPAYNFDKIFLDAYKQLSTPAGPRYPEVNTAILNRVNSGALVVNWVGHGGETNWAHERIFNMADIVPLANKEKLPLFITATCEFGRFDLPDRTAGEWLVVNGKGGGIAAITTLRLVYQSANEQIASATFQNLFRKYEGRMPTLGEVVMNAKNAVSGSAENTRKFTLLGDPALTLNYPHYNVITTSVNDKAISQDTLKALKQVTIKGELRDDSGNKLSSFNGLVYPLVYDKISTQQTLDNDGGGTMTFQLYKNILFKGKASIINGNFSFSFIVPKDINYQFGYGRISYYADNGSTDAHGYTDSITIGGSADSFIADANGPKMDLYMNDEKFVFGGITNADPMLLLKLSDETGINTVGNGIGHDITAVLDDNTQNKVVLNEYYESALDNYRKGEVKYPYSKLADGRHTLKVKAWDIYNNSSEDYTEFIVASNAKLALSHVYNYPNPFTTHTQFMFEHNRCCDDLSISVQIYTVSGKLVKSIVQQVYSEGYRVDNIEWNGLDDYGDPIGKGVYVYKLNVRDSNGNSAHKFQKLVVLR